MAQLFDLFLACERTNVLTFQMRAPSAVIAQVLKFGDRAIARIDQEASLPGETCTLHKNGFRWIVQRAFAPLGTERDSNGLLSRPAEQEDRRTADRIDGYDRDDLGESPDF